MRFRWTTAIAAGTAYMLLDQEKTRRVQERPQPGACLHCHASVIPTYRRLGTGDAMEGRASWPLAKMPYQQAHEEVVKTGSMNPTGRIDPKTGKPEM